MTQHDIEALTAYADELAEWGITPMVVALSDCYADLTYQRTINVRLVRELQAAFDGRLAGVPLLAQREDGKFWVIDGNNRINAGRRKGKFRMPAHVLRNLTKAEEADLFVRLQELRLGHTPLGKFKGELIAEHPEAVAINAVVEGLGGYVGQGGLEAIGTLRELYKSVNETGIRWILMVIRDAWPDDALSGMCVQADMLWGVSFFFFLHSGQFERGRLVQRLSLEGPAMILQTADRMRGPRGMTRKSACYYAVLDLYNKGLGEKALDSRKPDVRVLRERAKQHLRQVRGDEQEESGAGSEAA